MTCAAPDQGGDLPAGTDLGTATVLNGRVRHGDEPVAGAFVRLLDADGEFTAEVVASAAGEFRFFVAPGTLTVRVLSRAGDGRSVINAEGPGRHQVDVTV